MHVLIVDLNFGIDEECLDDHIKELGIKEKLHYHLSKHFDEKLNTKKLSHLLKIIVTTTGFEPLWFHLNFRYHACFEQVVRWNSGTIESRFTLKCVHDMIIT